MLCSFLFCLSLASTFLPPPVSSLSFCKQYLFCSQCYITLSLKVSVCANVCISVPMCVPFMLSLTLFSGFVLFVLFLFSDDDDNGNGYACRYIAKERRGMNLSG